MSNQAEPSLAAADPVVVESDLVTEAQRGDTGALGALYDLYHQPIYRYVRARLVDPERSEDITAEIFRRMLVGLHGYRPTGQGFRAWLFRLAHNAVIDDYRVTSRHAGVQLCDRSSQPGPDMAEAVERQVQAQQAYQALSELDSPQREVVALRFLAGLSLREVAAALGRSEDSVKALQRRGLAALRLAMAEERGGPG